MRRRWDPLTAWFASAAGHGVLFVAIQGEARAPEAHRPTVVSIEVSSERREPVNANVGERAADTAPAPAPAPAPSPEPTPRRARRTRPVAEETPRADLAPTPSFDGLTLSNANGDWAAPAGTGRSRQGPLGPAGNDRRAQSIGTGEASGTADGPPRLVSVGNLTRRPRQPADLGPALDRLYPRAAREQGIEGRASVRARIGADGRARVVAVLEESYRGFGATCRRLVDRSRGWLPGLDRRGQPVDTLIAFPCRFEIRR